VVVPLSRILVAGSIAGAPGQAGATWAILQYVLGFRKLGHEVTLVEPVASPAPEVVDYFEAVVAEFDLSASLLTGERKTVGLPYDELLDSARAADVLVNVSGMLRDDDLRRAPIRVYLDLDPAFNQLWNLQGIDAGFEGHTHYVTVGLAVGEPDCGVPTGGLDWTTTVPPVVLDLWPAAGRFERDAYTTIGNWRGYGSIEHDGKHYGQRAHSLRRFLDLPERSGERFELALAIHPQEKEDLAALEAHGWTILDPAREAGTPAAYARFIRTSKAELGIAKSGYVVSASGWFSDRSACYLASGRPVVAQDTGFSRFLPTGRGLLAFGDTEGAAAATAEVREDYAAHSRRARELAEELFDSDRVLTRLLDRVGGA
jgi:hypothetical protein